MATISQERVRNNVGDVLLRAEAGEEITITAVGRPIAELGPTGRRRWVRGPALRAVWNTPTPAALAEDLERFLGSSGTTSRS